MKGRVERRNHIDITPGLLFYHASDPKPSPWAIEDDRHSGAHLVITKRYVQKMDGGYWEYLLLSPGPKLDWDTIQWMIRIYDPKFET